MLYEDVIVVFAPPYSENYSFGPVVTCYRRQNVVGSDLNHVELEIWNNLNRFIWNFDNVKGKMLTMSLDYQKSFIKEFESLINRFNIQNDRVAVIVNYCDKIYYYKDYKYPMCHDLFELICACALESPGNENDGVNFNILQFLIDKGSTRTLSEFSGENR